MWPESRKVADSLGLCRVRDFEVIDIYPFGVQLTWEKEGSPTTSIVFEKGGSLPSTKSLTFYR